VNRACAVSLLAPLLPRPTVCMCVAVFGGSVCVPRYEFVNPSDQHIQWLWEVLEDMSNDDRVKFIMFCYARYARVPAVLCVFVGA
jgi:hypothetical protein